MSIKRIFIFIVSGGEAFDMIAVMQERELIVDLPISVDELETAGHEIADALWESVSHV